MDDDVKDQEIARLKKLLAEAEGRVKKADARADRGEAGQQIAAAAAAAGVLPTAIPDAINRALADRAWKEIDGRLVRVDASGYPEIGPYGDRITPAAAVKALRETAPHFFADEVPAGNSTSTARPTASAAPHVPHQYRGPKNPWRSGNRTEQAQVFKSNPDLAQQLADEAGVPLVPGNRPLQPQNHQGLRR